ncbi:reverse transcriptase domain-containing protein [Tanacetum coccineum]
MNAECFAIIMNKVPEKLEDPGKFLIPCALQELSRTSALATDSGASINLLPHSIYKKLELEALTPTRMTLELANRSISHPMGIAEDVVVRVDGFTFLADFVVVNFEPDPRVPIILGRPFLRTAKALIDLYEEKLTLRVGKDELVYYADKSEKNKEKNFVHAISVIDFSKDDPFSGSTTTHSDDPSPSSSPVKTSDNFEKFADELAPLDLLPPGNDNSTLKKVLNEENFQVNSNPLFELDDNFKSSTINPLFDEMEENVEIKNSNVSDEPVLLNKPLSDKDECFAPEDDNDEIDDFLAMEVSSNLEEGYFDSEGDIAFLDNLLSDDDSHNLDSKVTSDHEPEQNESSITFSPRSDPLHHEFAGEPLTLPARNDREFEEYLSLMTVLHEISTSQGNFHQNSVNMSLSISPIPVDSEPTQEEIDILIVPDDLIPPGVEDTDSEDEVNESPNLDHQDDPSIPLKTAGDHRKLQLNELNELRDQAYENSLIYKEKTKKLHDSKIKNRIFNVGDQVLLFNSRLKIFSGKLKTRWSGPFTIAQVFPYGTVELSQPDGPNFKVNGHRVKHYFGGDIPPKVVPDLHTLPKDN